VNACVVSRMRNSRDVARQALTAERRADNGHVNGVFQESRSSYSSRGSVTVPDFAVEVLAHRVRSYQRFVHSARYHEVSINAAGSERHVETVRCLVELNPGYYRRVDCHGLHGRSQVPVADSLFQRLVEASHRHDIPRVGKRPPVAWHASGSLSGLKGASER
jgi:hypothetical protein